MINGWFPSHLIEGPVKRSNGYLFVKVQEPYSGKILWIPYHRYLWEEHYQKCIKPGYVIHHADGNKENNDIDNLIAMPSGEHFRLHKKAWSNARRSKRRKRKLGRSTVSARPSKFMKLKRNK